MRGRCCSSPQEEFTRSTPLEISLPDDDRGKGNKKTVSIFLKVENNL